MPFESAPVVRFFNWAIFADEIYRRILSVRKKHICLLCLNIKYTRFKSFPAGNNVRKRNNTPLYRALVDNDFRLNAVFLFESEI